MGLLVTIPLLVESKDKLVQANVPLLCPIKLSKSGLKISRLKISRLKSDLCQFRKRFNIVF